MVVEIFYRTFTTEYDAQWLPPFVLLLSSEDGFVVAKTVYSQRHKRLFKCPPQNYNVQMPREQVGG